jgi:TonB-linked SusC/RagA family outer membrane protein
MEKICTQSIFTSGKTSMAAAMRLLLMVPVLLLIFSASVYAQGSIKISGAVTDGKGETVIGATVKVKGTAVGTVTDVNGKYIISVPNTQAVLVVSYIGLLPKEEVVGSRTVVNFKLEDNSTNLSEVIVTGYGGSVAKRDLVGSIGTVSAKQIAERQPTSLADALEGQIAGAQVVTDGGDPMSQGTIQIRGASTLNAGIGPLYVIDGVLNDDASFLNPQDIASIEVLKDAASSAIYGVRGANGVIIITTKGGKEGKARLNINYYHLFGKLAHKLQTASSKDVNYYRKVLGGGAAAGAATNPDSVSVFDNQDNDYQNLFYRTSNKDNLNLSVGGGSKTLQYYASVNYFSDRSIIINSYLNGFNTQFNVDYQATDKLKLINHISVGYSSGNVIDIANSANQIFQRNPWVSLYRPDGSLAGYVESKRNPIAFALLGENVPTTYTVQDNVALNYSIFKDLKFTASANARLDDFNRQTFTPLSITSGALGPNTGTSNFDNKLVYELQAFFNYTKTFGKDHSITAVVGYSRDRHRDDGYNISLQNYLSEGIRVSSVADLVLAGTTTTVPAYNSTESVFARAQYSYKDKYIINGTIRRDGSSRFGPDNKWGNFGAGGAAWRFSAEPFMAWSKSFLDDAKLRYSVGVLGNDKVGDFAYATQLNFGVGNGSSNSGVYNGNNGVYVSPSLGNQTIHWEQTIIQNFGMDLTMFNGRLVVTPEYFIKNTNGLLSSLGLPEETGLKSSAINLGNIANNGVEITISGTPISKKDFSWNTNFNITFQKPPLIKKLNTNPRIADSYIVQEGGHIGDMYLLKNLGVYQYNVSNAYDVAGNRLTPVGVNAAGTTATGYLESDGSPYTGVIHQLKRGTNVLPGGATIWQDINNDGQIDESDRQVLGNGVPTVYWGINNFITYKRFTLNFLFNASFGNNVYNEIANSLSTETSNYTPPPPFAIYGAWQHPGDIAIYPTLNANVKDNGYLTVADKENSLYMENGAFIRLSSAKLSYNLDPRIMSKIGAKTFNVYVYGNNLATWTNYRWYDPEFTAVSFLEPGYDNGRYPRRREVGLGLTVGF